MKIVHCVEGILFILHNSIEGFVFPKMTGPSESSVKFLGKKSFHTLEYFSNGDISGHPIQLVHMVGHANNIKELKTKSHFTFKQMGNIHLKFLIGVKEKFIIVALTHNRIESQWNMNQWQARHTLIRQSKNLAKQIRCVSG